MTGVLYTLWHYLLPSGIYCLLYFTSWASLVAQVVKNLHCRRPGFNSWVGKIPWRREWQPSPVFLPGEFHGQRSLAIVPGGCKEPNMTELWTHTHKFSPIALIPLEVLQSFLFHLPWGADFLALKGLLWPGPCLTACPLPYYPLLKLTEL